MIAENGWELFGDAWRFLGNFGGCLEMLGNDNEPSTPILKHFQASLSISKHSQAISKHIQVFPSNPQQFLNISKYPRHLPTIPKHP